MIVCDKLCKSYPGGFGGLHDISCRIESGEMVFVLGPSGAGKTTFCKMIAAIERPTSGVLKLNGHDLVGLRRSALPLVRRSIGIVFQNQRLLFDRSVIDNVMFPLEVAGAPTREAKRRAQAALDKVGLLSYQQVNPRVLSGGEQQRLSIARAIVNRPSLIVADEPTANLDEGTTVQVMDLFRAFHQVGVTVVISTHEFDWADYYQAPALHLEAGRLRPASSKVAAV